MKKRIFPIVVTALTVTLMAGFKMNNKPTTNSNNSISACQAEDDTLITDSVVFRKTTKEADVHIYVDWPEEQSPVKEAIANCVEECFKNYFITAIYGNPDAKIPQYQAKQQNAQALVIFYGEENVKAILKKYQNNIAEGMTTDVPYINDISIKRTTETNKYVTYTAMTYLYLGGAHGSTLSRSFNFSKLTNKKIDKTIDTTKVKELQPLLRKGLLQYFSEAGEQKITKNELKGYLLIEGDQIPLPVTQPILTPEGLSFIYGQYEIAPYAMGMPSFVVPYKEIQKYMTKEAKELINK